MHEFAVESALKYGHKGTDTLEYIGLTLENGRLLRPKLYHFAKNDFEVHEGWRKEIFEKWLGRICDNYEAKICDFSEAGTSDAPTYRMILQFRRFFDKEHSEKLITEEFPDVPYEIKDRCIRSMNALREGLGTQESPLMQVGIELDASLKFKSFKYYLCVERTSIPKDELAEAMSGFADGLGVNRDTERTGCLTADICSCWYRPTFIGVNDGTDETEVKLYYISELFGRSLKTKPAEQIKLIGGALKLDNGLTDELMKAWKEAHLYPEGVAFTLGDPSVLRLYLKELNEAYFR